MPSATELYQALKKKNIGKCLTLLSGTGIQINDIVQPQRRWTCLTEACVLGDEEIVEKILYKGADCNHKSTEGKTPLMFAADNGHTKVVDTLISEGRNCDVNDKDNDGNTALHYAARNGHTETTEVLLHHQAALNKQTEEGKTPLFFALKKKHADCVELLLQNGADVNLADHDKETPLHVAARAHEPSGLSRILQKCSDVNITDAEENTALHLLLKVTDREVPEDPVLECCELLLKHKVDCSRRNIFNKLAVDYVPTEKMPQVVKLLQKPVNEPVGHAAGMGGAKLKYRVKALEEGQRRHSNAIEEVSANMSTINKTVKDVDNTVKGLKGQVNKNREQIAQVQHQAMASMENLKNDLERCGLRPRTGKRGPVARPASPEDVEHLKERIREIRVNLIRHIQPEVDDHVDFLYQERAITRAEYEDINSRRTLRDKARTLVSCIEENLTTKRFMSFLQSLRHHENTRRLAEELL